MEDYRDLIAWKRSMELVRAVYALTKRLPKEETFAQKGGKNAETILLDQITEVLADQYALADIADTFVEDRKLIGKLLVKQMIADGFAAVKSKDDIKKLTAEQHLQLDAIIAAVLVLLLAICFVGGLLRLAVGMDLI